MLAVALAASWQTLTVHYNYHGNWTALYCTGDRFYPPPAALASENIYRFPNSWGYDGQSYHYIAHDPFLRRGFSASIDSPRFRYRRILIPLSAWALALGCDQWVDPAYLAVIWLWIFAGTFWTAGVIGDRGGHPAWALGFLLIAAVTVSIDRLTVDVAIVALTSGVIFYAARGRWGAVASLCLLACLVRESGPLMPAAVAAWLLGASRFRPFLAVCWTPAPALAWYAWVTARTKPGEPEGLLSPIPFGGLLTRLATPTPYPFSPLVSLTATVLDYAALLGLIYSIAYCAIHWRRLARGVDGSIAFASIALVAVISTQAVWMDAYAFARGFSPLLLIVWLDGFRASQAAGAAAIALTAPRIGAQIGSQITRVLLGLTGR